MSNGFKEKALELLALAGQVVPIADSMDGQAVKDRLHDIIHDVAEPLEDGFQWSDLLIMREPLFRGLVVAVSNLSMSNPAKAELVTAVVEEHLNHWDPEVDFTLPGMLRFIPGLEHAAEEATDLAIIICLRRAIPMGIEAAVDWMKLRGAA